MMETGRDKPISRRLRLRSRRALVRLGLALVCVAISAWLLWRGYTTDPTRPPWFAFAVFVVGLLAVLADPGELRIPRPRRRGAGVPGPVPEVQAGKAAALPEPGLKPAAGEAPSRVEPAAPESLSVVAWLLRLRVPFALVLALIAQWRLEMRAGDPATSVILYLAAAGVFAWSLWDRVAVVPRPEEVERAASPVWVRVPYLVAAGILALLTYLASSENHFRASTLLFWVGALVCLMLGLWERQPGVRPLWSRLRSRLSDYQSGLRLDGWSLLVLIAFGFLVVFRSINLSSVPLEMWSDHAEKLLDVNGILKGEYLIFFPRNTGREAMQFYLAAAVAQLLGTGISFITLKITTLLAGLVTLPYIYLFGREYGGRQVGLGAMMLAGVAFWPNILSRLGLRFVFYPLLVAPAMYHLARGLRLRRRNDLLLSGLFAGIGLYGYSPARVLPLALAAGAALYLMHRSSRGHRREAVAWFAASGLVGLVVFVPLLRVAIDMPDLYMLRALTRMTSIEQGLTGPPFQVFRENLWKAMGMFGWDNGSTWVVTVPYRPALDWITAALFHLGVVLALVSYLKRRDWKDLFILLSIIILTLPSSLALAFPWENPSPNRASGAIVPVFTLAALALVAIFNWVKSQWRGRWGVTLGLAGAVLLFGVAAGMNYHLVMDDFQEMHRRSIWNTSEAGRVVRNFAETIGDYDTAHVMAYPYWMDTRLVGMVAGKPEKDYAMWPDELDLLVDETRPQLFLINPQDEESVARLGELFPRGALSTWDSAVDGMEFLMYLVPATQGAGAGAGP